jgi:outer membrane receptor protein involved in Fe transport
VDLPQPAPAVQAIEQVVVRPPRLPSLGRDGAYSVVEIASEALRASSSLDEALKTDPGVSLFRRTGSDAANPTIQGVSLRAVAPSGASRTLVTLEGVPQNDPFGGWVIWTALPPEGVERAHVVHGAGSGPYGAGALTGAIALDAIGAQAGLHVLELSGGERGSARAAAAGGGSRLLLVGAAQTTEGYTPVRAGRGAADQPTWLRARSLQAAWRPTFEGTEAELQLSAYDERRGAGLVGAGSRARGAAAALTLARPVEGGLGGWRAQAWVRASDLQNRSVAVAQDRSATTPANDQYATPATSYGASGAWQGLWKSLSWDLGGDVRLSVGRSKERFRRMGGAFTRDRVSGGHAMVAGVYGEAVWRRGAWLVTGGARVDRWRQSHGLRRELDLTTGALVLNEAARSRDGVVPTGRIAIRRGIGDRLFVRTAAYAGFRPPTLNELHRPFRVGNDVTEANPGLKPERLYGVEAGLGGEGRTAWSLTAFYNQLEDPVANVTVGIGPGVFASAGFIPDGGVLRQRRNIGAVKAYGVEGAVSAPLGPKLSGRAAFAWTHARVHDSAAAAQLDGKRPAQSAALTATVGADWRASPRLGLGVEARFESARYEDDLNLRRLSPGLTVDLRAAYRVAAAAEFYLAAENLFGAAIEVGETANGVESFAAPRTLRVGFSYRR